MARDLRGLRQRVQLGQSPGLRVADHAGELELVLLPVDVGDLVLGVEGVEREGLRDRALGEFRGEPRLAEDQRLRAVVPARHGGEQLLHALSSVSLQPESIVSAPSDSPCRRNNRRSTERHELGRERREARFHGALFHVALLARPVIIVGKVRGTRMTIAMWTSTMEHHQRHREEVQQARAS